MPGTDLVYGGICLRPRYAISGTDVDYAATRRYTGFSKRRTKAMRTRCTMSACATKSACAQAVSWDIPDVMMGDGLGVAKDAKKSAKWLAEYSKHDTG
eukprot:1683879-Rhodomonas_salina.2